MKIGVSGVRNLGRDFLELFSLHPDVASMPAADHDPDARASFREDVCTIRMHESLDELRDTDVNSSAIFTLP